MPKERVIMCVDDEEIVLRSLQRQLNDALQQEYLIENAQGGRDALALFQELRQAGHEIPLIIADHLMPDMKGADLLIQIHQIAPRTLKIMLTGQADMDAVTQALNHADLYRYIAKPWEHTDLLLTVKEALRRYTQERQLAEQNVILQNVNVHLEQQVNERTAALQSKQEELEEKNRQLQELNASKDKFFSIIAHDLKNPFTALLGYADILSEEIQTAQPVVLQQDVQNLRHAAQKLYALLNNLLLWSRIQRGVMPYAPLHFDLYELAQENTFLFLPQAKQKNVRLTTGIPEKTMIYADYQMLNTVVRNLLSNALKFTPEGGEISLAARRIDPVVEISVKDTGIGIAETDLTQLFRIDAHYTTVGTRGEEGTGLGLILCKELVEKNAGTIRVDSQVSAGTTFTVALPAPAAAGL